MRTESVPTSKGLHAAFLLCMTAMLLVLPRNPLWAADKAQEVIVFPFAINAQSDLDYLKSDLPSLFRDALSQRGFEVVSTSQTDSLLAKSSVTELNTQTVKDLGIVSGADFAVYGSMSQVGQDLSFDVRLVNPFSTDPPRAFYVTVQGLINIQTAVSELADKIENRIQRKRTIAEIEVTGNQILGKDVVLMRLRIQEGDEYSPQAINEEIKRLFATGYFQDVRVHAQEVREGIEVTFEVNERPVLATIEVKGADAISEDDILEAMSTKTGSVLNPKLMSQDVDAIRELYRKKGYYQAQVDYQQERVGQGKAKLVVDIEEGEKLYITEINIQGAEKLDEDELQDQLALTERGLFSWLTGGGVLREELLDRDAAALEAYYANRGFMDVRVGHPEVSYQDDGIHITFQVQEGPRYLVGQVSFQGDLITETQRLTRVVQMDDLAAENKPFDRSVLRDDTQSLTDFYANYGYAFAEANTNLRKNQDDRTIDVTFDLHKKHQVYIRRVLISGNQKTRDNVIRRHLHLTEGERFSGRRLSLSKQRLTRIDYFEEVNIETLPTNQPELMDLRVNIKEKSTGSFSAGAGYSSVDSVFFTGQVQERNLLGKGYSLSFQGSFSSETTRFQLSFWNPQLYDGPVGAGFDLFNTTRDYDEYDLDSTGGKLKFAYSVGTYTRLYWNYSLEQYDVTDIEEGASDEIKDLSGSNLSSSLEASVVRDTTNKRLNPTRGTKNILGLEYSGGFLGGDADFIKPEYEFSYFHPLLWKLVFNWHWKAGVLFENGDRVPDYERYYLGGINTVRGYDYRDISATDDQGDDIGGYKTLFSNFELVFPIKEDMGILGVTFFDAGNVWNKDEDIDLDFYKSVGAGIRWNSPMGPLRLEYGYPLDDLKGNDGKFEFSVGQFF